MFSQKSLLLLALYTALAGLLGWFLVGLGTGDQFLILLIVPAVLASLKYDRLVYVVMLGIGSLISVSVIYRLIQNPRASLLTLTVVVGAALILCEVLHHLETSRLAAFSARQRSEAELARSESQYRLLFSHNPVPTWVFDVETLRFLAVNTAAIKHYGFSQEEFLRMTIKDIRPPEEVPRLLEQLARPASSLQQSGIWKHRTKEGSLISMEIVSHSLEFEGRTARLVLATDITQRLHLEEQLRQAQKMEAFGQLAGGVAHDFNNVLSIIMGYTNLLMHQEGLGAEAREQLRQIYKAGERAAHLTRQLLTFSRRKERQVADLDLNVVVRDLAKMLGRIIREDIRVTYNCSEALPLIRADEGMMEQVLMNLCVNARDAMAQGGGELIVGTRALTVAADDVRNRSEAQVGEFVCLSVQDTGCGIEPEVLPRIFEPFFTTKEAGKGTGLGLATVYGIVKQHEGWMEVESQVGVGTTFKVFLPVSASPVPAQGTRPAEPQPRGGTETILVVEDEEALRALARLILQRAGYQVLEAASGVEALSVWEKHASQVDLMLTDVIMPDGLTGRELAKQLLARNPDLKVIYTSGHNVEQANTSFVFREASNFLQKPYHPQKLLQVVRSSLDLRDATDSD